MACRKILIRPSIHWANGDQTVPFLWSEISSAVVNRDVNGGGLGFVLFGCLFCLSFFVELPQPVGLIKIKWSHRHVIALMTSYRECNTKLWPACATRNFGVVGGSCLPPVWDKLFHRSVCAIFFNAFFNIWYIFLLTLFSPTDSPKFQSDALSQFWTLSRYFHPSCSV